MYEPLKDFLLDLLRAPKEPPAPPAGTHESVQIFRASPQFLRYQYVGLGLFAIAAAIVIGIIGIVLVANDPFLGLVALILVGILWFLVLTIAWFVIRIEYDMRYYIVTDRSLRIRKGVLSILEQTLTFVNIQNISVEQGPIERVFGIARLVVETAGGGGAAAQQQGYSLQNYHKAVMNGLDNAQEIKELIVSYLRSLPDSGGLGVPDDRESKRASRRRKGFTPQEIMVLQEILHEARALRQTIVKSDSASP